ncbi:MAG: fructosamine kinase family protein [Planctomycetes bacterium]|nr:fructosamine kinase family protein [Planctomycetota bacterium]
MENFLRQHFGAEVTVVSRRSVSGGCINAGVVVTLSSGESVFVKSNNAPPPLMFTREAESLREIAKSGAIRAPKVLAVQEHPKAFLALEAIREGRPSKSFFADFGRSLAKMHEFESAKFGFRQDNYCGRLLQRNRECDSWTEFFAQNRLSPQIELASRKGLLDGELLASLENLVENLGRYLPADIRPGLCHGDLWSGNFMCDETGSAVLIDPCAFYGDPETDLAMTELFGGFPGDFYAAYNEVRPISNEYYECRRSIYQLFHALNHVNHFGGSYVDMVRRLVAPLV